MLRVYAAAHGLTNERHAVVEVGADEIVLRVDTHWARFTHNAMTTSEGGSVPFSMVEDGSVLLDGRMDEMDMAAERVARELMQGGRRSG